MTKYSMETVFSGDCSDEGIITLSEVMERDYNCFITNNIEYNNGTLTIIKEYSEKPVVISDSDFMFYIDGEEAELNTPIILSPGIYAITEESLLDSEKYMVTTDYSECHDGTITIGPGEEKQCTITNKVTTIEEPQGSIKLYKYACPAGTMLGPNNVPDSEGAFIVPEECVPVEGAKFQYYYKENEGTTGIGPWITNPDDFDTLLGITDDLGLIIADNLMPGQYDIAEFMNNTILPDEEMLYFGCMYDSGGKEDNYEYTLVYEGQESKCVAYNKKTPALVTSNVMMCKEDDNGNRLEGWQLMLHNKDPVGTLEVYPNGDIFFLSDLPVGNYVIVSEGKYVYRNNPNARYTDAAFSQRLETDNMYNIVGPTYESWVRLYGYTNYLTLQVQGSSVDWGMLYNKDHVYAYNYAHAGGDIEFIITDDYYKDNSGYLTVKVYEGFAYGLMKVDASR
ncbi:MAG: hypothetical protein ACMXYL_01540 [Candidatus Woesearchaeota archaeon]